MNGDQDSITLRCDETYATIAPQRGAIVTSFRVRDRELLYLDQATFNDRSKNVRGGIPILFPSPGKLDGDQWRCAGKSGEMKQHGFARNLGWTIEGTQGRDCSQALLSLRANDETLQAYPWRFHAQMRYAVSAGALDIRFVVANEDSTPMPFAIGLHPYFLVTDKSQARIPTPATRAFDNVAKRYIPFGGFDFTHGEVDIHLLDHGGAHAQLVSGPQIIAVEGSEEFTRWVVWSLPGKDFICLEPWSALGNALNTGEDVIMLAPSGRRELRVRISVGP
jgi:galactose mutarotase-like enzyme